MIDPNATMPAVREVRVTMRGVRLSPDGSPVQVSTRSDFIAPELSAPSTLAIELDKGMRGWTDHAKRVPPAYFNGGIVSGGERDSSIGYNVGATVIRHTAPTAGMIVRHRTGPRPGRKA